MNAVGPRIQVTSTRAMLEAAARRGVDVDDLLTRHQVSKSTMADPDARLPVAQVNALWTDLIDRTDNPQLPVWAALELPWGAYRVIDYLCSNADTLGSAIQLLSDVFRIVNDSVRLVVSPTDEGGAVLRIVRSDGGDIPPMYLDYTMAACITRFSVVIGADVHPSTVGFRRSVPADPAAHLEAFGPGITFGQDRDEAVFGPELWATKSKSPDPGLRDVLHRHATTILQALPVVDPLIDEIRNSLVEGLPHGHAELGWIAKQLGTSSRTLQRRLSAKGLQWREFAEETRFALARGHLARNDLSVEEVGLLVGYSDPSSFHRAFVRWTNQAPGQWRRSH